VLVQGTLGAGPGDARLLLVQGTLGCWSRDARLLVRGRSAAGQGTLGCWSGDARLLVRGRSAGPGDARLLVQGTLGCWSMDYRYVISNSYSMFEASGEVGDVTLDMYING